MNLKPTLAIPVCLFGVFAIWITGSTGLPNLTDNCYRCLCHVSTECLMSNGCKGGYCGPFNISRIVWVESGIEGLLENDGSERHSWRDCTLEYNCSVKVLESYFKRFVKDCNGDDVIDCFDYMMIYGNGGYDCSAPLNRSARGRMWLKRYEQCKL